MKFDPLILLGDKPVFAMVVLSCRVVVVWSGGVVWWWSSWSWSWSVHDVDDDDVDRGSYGWDPLSMAWHDDDGDGR